MCACSRSCVDVMVVTSLVLMTTYSVVSFYNYIFRCTFQAVAHRIVDMLRYLAHLALQRSTQSMSTTPDNPSASSLFDRFGGTCVVNGMPYTVYDISVVNVILLVVSGALLWMFVWAYYYAVVTSPGFVPGVFKQAAPLSSVLALSAFYEPLPQHSSDVAEDRYLITASSTPAHARPDINTETKGAPPSCQGALLVEQLSASSYRSAAAPSGDENEDDNDVPMDGEGNNSLFTTKVHKQSDKAFGTDDDSVSPPTRKLNGAEDLEKRQNNSALATTPESTDASLHANRTSTDMATMFTSASSQSTHTREAGSYNEHANAAKLTAIADAARKVHPRDIPSLSGRETYTEVPMGCEDSELSAQEDTPLRPLHAIERFYFNRRKNCFTSTHNTYLDYCPSCASYKPPRAHHCSRCSRCILKYDHHCPWLGQCVGFFNYKNYLLVLLYAWLLATWVLLLLIAAMTIYTVDSSEGERGGVVGQSNSNYRAREDNTRTTSSTAASSLRATHTYSSTRVLREKMKQGLTRELDVGPPSLGVFVCFGQALLFVIMTSYLLLKHWTYSRYNVTTIDMAIYDHVHWGQRHPRTRGAGADAEEEASSFSASMTSQDLRTATMKKSQAEKRPRWVSGMLFATNHNIYAARSVDRFIEKNIYNVGVRRNLLQVFGDAKVHGPLDLSQSTLAETDNAESDMMSDRNIGRADTQKRMIARVYMQRNKRHRHPYFADLMKNDAFEHPQGLVRWFCRLLPYPAYGHPMAWRPLGDNHALMFSARTLQGQRPHGSHGRRGRGYASYGAVDTCRNGVAGDVDGNSLHAANENEGDNILDYLGIDERQLLGLRFPTRASSALTRNKTDPA